MTQPGLSRIGRWGGRRRRWEENAGPGNPGPEIFNCQDCLWEREIKPGQSLEECGRAGVMSWGCCNSWLKPLQQLSQQIPPAGCRSNNCFNQLLHWCPPHAGSPPQRVQRELRDSISPNCQNIHVQLPQEGPPHVWYCHGCPILQSSEQPVHLMGAWAIPSMVGFARHQAQIFTHHLYQK